VEVGKKFQIPYGMGPGWRGWLEKFWGKENSFIEKNGGAGEKFP